MDIPSTKSLLLACKHLPLFPLPQVSLFPMTVLRLHVFEPRYVQMIKECMLGNKLIAVASIVDGWDRKEGPPVVEPIAGIGAIVQIKELPDDRFLIILLGVGRIQIDGELDLSFPYRCAYGQLLAEPEDETDSFEIMRQMFVQLLISSPDLSKDVKLLLDEKVKAQHFCNAIAHLLLRDNALRQEYLCATSFDERCTLVTTRIVECLLLEKTDYEA